VGEEEAQGVQSAQTLSAQDVPSSVSPARSVSKEGSQADAVREFNFER
jgi:hypothetical protein